MCSNRICMPNESAIAQFNFGLSVHFVEVFNARYSCCCVRARSMTASPKSTAICSDGLFEMAFIYVSMNILKGVGLGESRCGVPARVYTMRLICRFFSGQHHLCEERANNNAGVRG